MFWPCWMEFFPDFILKNQILNLTLLNLQFQFFIFNIKTTFCNFFLSEKHIFSQTDLLIRSSCNNIYFQKVISHSLSLHSVNVSVSTAQFTEHERNLLMKTEIYFEIEAVAQTCSVKKVFLEISQNSQENTCARVSFLIKLQAPPLVAASVESILSVPEVLN